MRITEISLTLLQRSTSGDGSGVEDSSSIMVFTVSGTLVMSQHFSCQVGSFRDSISLAWGDTQRLVFKKKVHEWRGATARYQLSLHAYLLVEVGNLIGEHAVFVCQEAETPLFLQQRLSAAVSDELLHVHLAR